MNKAKKLKKNTTIYIYIYFLIIIVFFLVLFVFVCFLLLFIIFIVFIIIIDIYFFYFYFFVFENIRSGLAVSEAYSHQNASSFIVSFTSTFMPAATRLFTSKL